MKSNLWVLCGIALLFFGSVKCKRYFSDEDDYFLDKTGDVDEIKNENEEDLEWELYKAKHIWNDVTNELAKLQQSETGNSHGTMKPKVNKEADNGNKLKMKNEPERAEQVDDVSEKECRDSKPNCIQTGGICKKKESEIFCECGNKIDYDNTAGCKVPKETCNKEKKDCIATGGICKTTQQKGIICDCGNGITYDDTNACKVPEKTCNEQKKDCIATGGICKATQDKGIICDCGNGITYDDTSACKVPEKTCNEQKKDCIATGGICKTTQDKGIICDCGNGITYDDTNACKVPEEICNAQKKNCISTGGVCKTTQDKGIICDCGNGKTYDETNACNEADICKTKCGKKPGVTCERDTENEANTKCLCVDKNKAFDTKDKECKEDKCFTKCGIRHDDGNDELKCDGGPFGDVKCICNPNNPNLEFDPSDKKCKTNYCKEKCGDVECDPKNKFEEDKVECKCKEYEDFDDKKCKVNYCKKVCGTASFVECEKVENKPKEPKCKCSDEDYVYIDKKCKKKCNDDCQNNGTCENKGDYKLCKCNSLTTGDLCEDIVKCKTGDYKNCNGDRGECVIENNKVVCNCPEGKKFFSSLKYCEVGCNEDKDCEGPNRKCSAKKYCECQEGYEGENCGVVTGCKTLEEKCIKIGTICEFNSTAPGKASCKCPDSFQYDHRTNECKHDFCHPKNPCEQGSCTYDNSSGIAYCKCEENKYYNYKTRKCEVLKDKCLLRRTPCDENYYCDDGECKCKYSKKKDEDCKPNLCPSGACFDYAKCRPNDGSCYCEETRYYKSEKCASAGCSFKDFKTNCTCPFGTERKENGSECVLKKGFEPCSEDCGYGVCFMKDKKNDCKCFSFADLKDGKCILKTSYCEGGKLQEDKMKCKCEGKYTQAENDITCRPKTCEDEGVKEECAEKGAKCVTKTKKLGYECECPKGYGIGDNGKCTEPCSIENNLDSCAQKDQLCFNSLSPKNKLTGSCKCPPTLKMENNKCSGIAENVFLIKNIFVLKKRYEMKSGINKVLLNEDLVESVKQTFVDFEYGYLYDMKEEGDELNCSVWTNLNNAVKKTELDKIRMMSMKFFNVCKDCDDDALVWPPNLLLSEKGLKEAETTKLTFCSNEVKDLLCGKEAKCENNKCTCKEGFQTIAYTIRKFGGNTAVRCADIDECATNSHSCGGNTTCVNTAGSYKCVCKEGYKKAKTPEDPETDKSDCYDMCSPPYPCGNGECSLVGKTFNCQCRPGVGGSFCDRDDVNYKSAKHGTVVVGAVLGTLLAVVAIAMLYYIIKVKKRSGSEDFMPAPRMDRAEMTERRPVRGVTNRAYE